MRRVRVTIVAVLKKYVLQIVCACVRVCVRACVCVCVVFGIQHTMRRHHIVICSLPRSTIISALSNKRHDLGYTAI